jgi:tetratricopeptide (TPR) repeat protein
MKLTFSRNEFVRRSDPQPNMKQLTNYRLNTNASFTPRRVSHGLSSVVHGCLKNLARVSVSVSIALLLFSPYRGVSQSISSGSSDAFTVAGKVYDAAHHLVSGATVRLQGDGTSATAETQTNLQGDFSLIAEWASTYTLAAEKGGLKSQAIQFRNSPQHTNLAFELVLATSKNQTIATDADPMEFADKPTFTVAGVTDWTAVGGHGTDSSVHTSEVLTRETLLLKPTAAGKKASPADDVNAKETERTLLTALNAAPSKVETNQQLGEFYLRHGRYQEALPPLKAAFEINPERTGIEYSLALAYQGLGDFYQANAHVHKLLTPVASAEIHRLAAELDEKLNDALTAVHEYELAARLDPSEQNYFEWGSELLLHRAVAQAQEVLTKGVAAYPGSSRMLAALGTAFLASALYEEAANRLCQSSDLAPAVTEPYLFMGRVEIASPAPLSCIEPRLARFVKLQPDNSLGNYFYAMSLLKRQEQAPDPQTQQQIEDLLTKAVSIDSQCGDAYLQLGILNTNQHHMDQAVEYFSTAIRVNPQLSEAHYRLGLVYDRLHKTEMAKHEFQLHDEIEKQQADAIEQQRREIKQFRVVLPAQPDNKPSH